MRRILAKYNVYILFFALMLVVLFFAAHTITLKAYKNSENSKVGYINGIVSHNDLWGKTIDGYNKLSITFFDQSADEVEFTILLICMKNLLTLFNKLIVILSLHQFYLYIIGWIIMVSQIINNYFLMHYLQLKVGKKCVLSNQLSFSF